jgi:uncharacterized repeat protein (TIGR03803 family)
MTRETQNQTRNDAKNNAVLTRGFQHSPARGEPPCRAEPSRSQPLSEIRSVLPAHLRMASKGRVWLILRYLTQPPLSRLIQATNGNLYGTTSIGGANVPPEGIPGAGTVFKIILAGKLTTLYSFCAQTNCTDGAYPDA